MRYPVAMCAALYLLQAGPTQAQQAQQAPQQASQQHQPSPEEMQKIMDATMGAMVPVMGRMVEVMVEAQLKIAVLPETADRIARFKKNLYDALLKQGFSKDQAMQLVIATGLPSATPASK